MIDSIESRCCTTKEDWDEMIVKASFSNEVFNIIKKYCNNGNQHRLFYMFIDLFNQIIKSKIFLGIHDKCSLDNYIFRLLEILTGSRVARTKCSQISIIKHKYCRNNKCISGSCSYLSSCGSCYNSHNLDININDSIIRMCKKEKKKTDNLLKKYNKKEK